MEKNKIKNYSSRERSRQRRELSLIASENFIYPDALKLAVYPLVNKYSEGYPTKRFYRGCKFINLIENEAIEAAKELFKCKYANVQCFSGSIANLAIYQALLKPGDVILGLEMSSGGHLSHTSPYSFVSSFYKTFSYELDKNTKKLNYEKIRKKALEVRPKLIIAGFSSYPFNVDFKKFREIADEVDAYLLADICHLSGLIATGLHEHCFPHAHVAMCTTHKQLRGYRGALILWNNDDLTTAINKSVFPGLQGGMNPSAVAINAYCLRKNLLPEYFSYMQSVLRNAKIMVSFFKEKGLSVIGTDTHLFLLDTKSSFNLTGKKASIILESAGYITNQNLLPFDEESPYIASGIRMGTLCLSTLNPTEEEVKWIAEQIYIILLKRDRQTISKAKMDLKSWLSKKNYRN